LNGIEKGYTSEQFRRFNSLFNDKNITPEAIALLQQKFEGDGLTPQEKGKVNAFRSSVLKYLNEYHKKKATNEQHVKELFNIAKKVDELRGRILNLGAHPGDEPLFETELKKAVEDLEKFQEVVLQLKPVV